MGSINLSFLTNWYDSQAGIVSSASSSSSSSGVLSGAAIAAQILGAGSSATTTSSSSSTTTTSTPSISDNPTPPWSVTTSGSKSSSTPKSTSTLTSAQTSSLVQSLLAGGKLVNPASTNLNLPTGAASLSSANAANYKNLFALYQGITGLQSIAQQASSTTPGPIPASQLQQAFQTGMQQLQSYLSGKPFSGFQVYQTSPQTSETTTAAVPQENDTYTGADVYNGAMNGVVPAFEGNVQFSLTATDPSGSQKTVNFNFADMGSTPRTMANVLAYMNGQMQAAGLQTRFTDSFTPGAPETTTVDGQTVNLGTSPDQYALKIQGVSTESLTFSAPTTDPAVYVGQSSGITSSDLPSGSSTTPDAVQQLVAFDASSTPADASAVNGQMFQQALGPNVSQVLGTATAPDGSVYVLADITGTTNGQSIQGSQDVALIKYDSAGNEVFTQTLGAATSASGYALAVSADGSQVAVVGSTTDNLDPTASSSTSSSSLASAGLSSSSQPPQGFVTVFDSQGDEEWTQQTAAIGGNGGGVQPNAVAFGSNGMVYVAGQVDGTIPGASSTNATESAYIQAFQATDVPLDDGSGQSQWVVTPTYANQFGATGQNEATGLAVSGSSVYVSSMENGQAVVRQFTQSGSDGTSLTQTASRNLGSVDGGNVAGVSVNSDGSVIVAGSTHNGDLNGGTVTQAYAGGEEAFVASLAPNLQPSSSDTITYLGSSTNRTATAMTTSGGQVYLTGQISSNPIAGTGADSADEGYVAAVNPQTGQVTWSQTYEGQENEAAPTSIAVSQTGASVLNQLGLPSSISYTPSQNLLNYTSLRPGDQFYIQSGSGSPVPVTISADDTYQTLAQKIESASNYSVTATVTPGTNGQTLKLAPAYPNQQVSLLPGAVGMNALSALGLQQGVLTSNASKESSPVVPASSLGLPPSNSLKNGYSLNLSTDLNLNDASDAKAAASALSAAASTIQGIYSDMTTPPSSSSSTSGSVPAYLTNEIANYQAGLARLTGSS